MGVNIKWLLLLALLAIYSDVLCEYVNPAAKRIDSLLDVGHKQLDIDFNRALEIGNTCLALSRTHGYTSGIAKSYMQLGRVYRRQRKINAAMYYFEKADSLLSELKDYIQLSNLNNSIAVIYLNERKYDKVIYYEGRALKCLSLAEKLGNKDSGSFVVSYLQLGGAYFRLSKLDTALVFFNNALVIAKLINDKPQAANCYDQIARVHMERGDYKKAIGILKISYAIKREYGDIVDLANSYLDLGYSYGELGDVKQAQQFLDKAKLCIDSIDLIDMKIVLWTAQIILSKKVHDYKRAFETLDNLYDVEDSLNQQINGDKITQMEASYENHIRTQENELLLKENQLKEEKIINEQRNRKWLVASFSMLAILGSVGFYYFYQTQKISRQKLQMQTKKELAESQFIAFQARMNPHFIFNSLNSIQYFITNNERRSSLIYLSKFAKLLRQVLDNSNDKKVCVTDEMLLVKSYIELEMLRFENRFNYEIEIMNGELINQMAIPSMIIQPMVENAIIHGLLNKDGDGFLRIHLYRKVDIITCVIEDNGIGRKRAAEIKAGKGNKYTSMGMRIAMDRLLLLRNDYDSHSPVEIVDLEENGMASGTRVILRLPILS